MKNIIAYYKMAILSDEVKSQNNITSKGRLDCIAYTGEYKGLMNFVGKKGQLFLYKTPCKELIKANSRRRAEWCLNNNSLNFSSIYIEDFTAPQYGYGYPNKKTKLSGGKPNPLYPYKDDAYLFIINEDYTEIEIFVIEKGRNFITQYYQRLIDEEFKTELETLRAKAKPFFNYIGLDKGAI